MINKQLYLIVVTGLFMIGGCFSSTRVLASPPPVHESVPLTQYWNIIAKNLARNLISRGRLGLNTIYVNKKHAASHVAQYLEKQLSISLDKSGVKLAPPTMARYAIELDVEINKRSNGHNTRYVEGGDIDQLWMIEELNPVYTGQYAHYQMIPLTMNQPVGENPLSGTDTEILITARIMEKGWIRLSQNFAFYVNGTTTIRENERSQDKLLNVVDEFGAGGFMGLQNHQKGFLNYQEKLDAHIQQLIDSYQF